MREIDLARILAAFGRNRNASKAPEGTRPQTTVTTAPPPVHCDARWRREGEWQCYRRAAPSPEADPSSRHEIFQTITICHQACTDSERVQLHSGNARQFAGVLGPA